MVVVLIGANDYGFAAIVQQCVEDWLLSPSWWPNYCNDDSSIRARLTASNIAAITANVAAAFQRLRTAMRNAGYADDAWTLLAQTYSSPIPNGTGFRYPQSGFTRQTVGGCGLWNRDADWANGTVVPTLNGSITNGAAQSGLTNVRVLDARNALVGHRLCERTDGLLEERGIPTWQSPAPSGAHLHEHRRPERVRRAEHEPRLTDAAERKTPRAAALPPLAHTPVKRAERSVMGAGGFEPP